MSLLDDLMLLSRNDDGTPRIHDLVLDPLLAAAALIDLRLAGALHEADHGSRLTSADQVPPLDPDLGDALARVQAATDDDVASLIKVLDHHMARSVRDRLTDKGRLLVVDARRLGLFTNLTWRPADPQAQADLVDRVRRASRHAATATDHAAEQDAALVALLDAAGVLGELVGSDDTRVVETTAGRTVVQEVRRRVRRRRLVAAAGASAGGTTGGTSG